MQTVLLCVKGPSVRVREVCLTLVTVKEVFTRLKSLKIPDLLLMLCVNIKVQHHRHPVPPAIPRLGIKPWTPITDCNHGYDNSNGTAFPQNIGLAATFRFEINLSPWRPIVSALCCYGDSDGGLSTFLPSRPVVYGSTV